MEEIKAQLKDMEKKTETTQRREYQLLKELGNKVKELDQRIKTNHVIVTGIRIKQWL